MNFEGEFLDSLLADNSPGGFLKFQAARLWIPQAGIAQRLDISPRAIRRLDDCGVLTVRLIPRCQAQALANEVNRLVAQHSRPASARG